MIRRLLKRWADESLQRQLADLEADLEAERRKVGILESEVDNLAAVVSRDRQRIMAEGAAYARQQAESEGVSGEQLASESTRRFSA